MIQDLIADGWIIKIGPIDDGENFYGCWAVNYGYNKTEVVCGKTIFQVLTIMAETLNKQGYNMLRANKKSKEQDCKEKDFDCLQQQIMMKITGRMINRAVS